MRICDQGFGMSVRLKYRPADFAVQEVCSRQATAGEFALYHLHKQQMGTPEAMESIARTWNLSLKQFSSCGLKDHRAVTQQKVVIKNGPRRNLESDRFQLQYVGQTNRPVSAADCIGNHFSIRLRDISPVAVPKLIDRFQRLANDGFPNYFDAQRFGSVPDCGRFAAAAQCRRDFETATWLALAAHNGQDRSDEQQQREILRNAWPNWDQAKAALKRSNRRSVVTYLVDHPTGFRKAYALISEQYRGLLLSAFQSYVWNQILASFLQPQEPMVFIGRWNYPVQKGAMDVPDVLPLPSSRLKTIDPAYRQAADNALGDFGLKLATMKTHFPRDRWFSKSQRKTFVTPMDFRLNVFDDEFFAGQQSLQLDFTLSSGCYATMFLRCACGELQE